MSEESERHGESAAASPSTGGAIAARVVLTAHQLEAAAAETLRSAWSSQDSYIDHLETLNKQLEGSLEKAKEVEDKIKQQYAESQHREKVLVRRLAAKEQEIQDYVSQITELKSSHASLNGRPTLLDPAVNVLILRLKQELTSTKTRLEETQNELSAWKFTPDSNTGKKLMAKCRLLHQENEDLGRMTSSGRIAKLEGDLALQKSFSEEVKKSQSELDDFIQELDEDVEGMQSTVLYLQQELRAARGGGGGGGSGAVNGARASPDKRAYSPRSDAGAGAPAGKRRRASVLSLDYNEDEEPLTVLRISDGKPTNKAVFIDGGIHAREWISPATVTFFINQFAENFDEESDDIKNTDWYFLPVVNPDGYEYTHTTDRLWRKNRKPSNLARVCSGTDLNRNFGYRWGGKGASSNPCSETFRGRTAFSEPESKALADFIKSSGANFSAYLTYHSYGQYLLYPWGYDNVVPPDYKDLDEVGKTIAKAIEETGGSKYSVGSSSGLLYPASGGSDDWAKAQGIKYSYTVELSDTGRYGFILPTSYIDPVAKESLAGLRALMKIIHG
ncbi:uncharacterized protein LOC134797683 isoform X2 [Cydia splendana]|uniref:uncharacterized protein LOC134797683 isoform X2 n=1 Tax=Cydia splendana TaxID=1100963 RepID=UPI00300D4A45